jgi:hypothetical protein
MEEIVPAIKSSLSRAIQKLTARIKTGVGVRLSPTRFPEPRASLVYAPARRRPDIFQQSHGRR